MDWQDVALGAAGLIGSGVAVFHGVLTQRLMVVPLEETSDRRLSAPIRRLVPVLLHLSTVSWFVGGLALIAAFWFSAEARLVTGIFVGGLYLYGAIGNFWGTRGRHPGWMLLAVALVLMVAGLMSPGATGS
ncbi:hypothetical protein M9M90_11180 [Phenylobacterium sp. LH3H17]|uniref:hypothetical protein n=1 Tax=Phenylobacterium sp. LH3H17 TaxID=2903901 RepID=UPI0020C93FDE|nr:hypothetical protein [Phenylobacterium sp. LH3H17]UTP37806.1 hypothetical protein M9M90_11180 [Phenylobacterium sp. LH3H17]